MGNGMFDSGMSGFAWRHLYIGPDVHLGVDLGVKLSLEH